jgi:hypothetical protein
MKTLTLINNKGGVGKTGDVLMTPLIILVPPLVAL